MDMTLYPIMLTLKELKGKEYEKEKYTTTAQELLILCKSVFISTKMFLRNPIMMRLISLNNEDFDEVFVDESVEQRKKFKNRTKRK